MEKSSYRSFKSLCACSLSSICSSFVTHPIDVLRVRLQTGQTSNKMLYSGIRASVLRNGSFVTSKMFTYNTMKHRINPKTFKDRVMCGMTAGAVGSIVGTPFDQVMVRIQNDPIQFKTINETIKHIVEKDGISGMWRSVYYTMSRAIVVTACQFGVYEQIKSDLGNVVTNDYTRFLISSSSSSIITSLLSNPIDVCKNRVMCGNKDVSIPNIVRSEGMLSLWKGLHLNVCRQIPLNIVRFGFLECFTYVFSLV